MRWCVERSAHRTWVSGTGHWCEGGIGDEESRQNVRADWPARARAGTVRARLWHRKGGVRPRYGRCRRFPARSRRADVRTIPDVTSRVHLSRCLVISSPTRKQRLIIAGGLCTYRPPAIETHRRERRRGPAFRAGRYYPRSAREFATCGGSRAPPRCVPQTRLFKSKGLKERGRHWLQMDPDLEL